MDAFKVQKDGQTFDYRVGGKLDLEDVKKELSQKFEVLELKEENRHVTGHIRIDNQDFFLKLATSVGISIRLENEKLWNEQYNKWSDSDLYKVPQNRADGYYKDLLYLVMDFITGPQIATFDGKINLIGNQIDSIIDFSEHIQKLPLDIPVNDAIQNPDHQAWFCEKTKSWLDSIPEDVRKRNQVIDLWKIVESGAKNLEKKPRHGDFTPWHMITEDEKSITLFDGEHAHSNGVENYDICYFIQRVHSILELPDLAHEIYENLMNRGYDKNKLQTVMASRAIGGFLDESLKPNPDYESENEFKEWVLSL